ncbi:MAG TPA: hypothetical protein VEF34_09445 [Syntrophobacteraceae bacterium]|nr:hypothetical protein [Syntrophobacteraceae bacterium]
MKRKDVSLNQSSALDPGDDAPDLTTLDLDSGEWFIGDRKVTPEEGKAAFRKALGAQVTISLDSDVAEYFQASAGKEGIEAAVNRVLRKHIGKAASE